MIGDFDTLVWYKIESDGYPPKIDDDHQLIGLDAQEEIRAIFCIDKSFIGYIVDPLSHWMIVPKPKVIPQEEYKFTKLN